MRRGYSALLAALAFQMLGGHGERPVSPSWALAAKARQRSFACTRDEKERARPHDIVAELRQTG